MVAGDQGHHGDVRIEQTSRKTEIEFLRCRDLSHAKAMLPARTEDRSRYEYRLILASLAAFAWAEGRQYGGAQVLGGGLAGAAGDPDIRDVIRLATVQPCAPVGNQPPDAWAQAV
jgi:hypothetical protein